MSPFILAILVFQLGSFICSLCAASFRPRRQRKNDPQLPPGPPALPIIGNLHMLGKLPHRSLHQLAKKYGPIMSMRLGSVPAIVVSSPQAAELFLKTHDLLFASRPMLQASLYMSYGNKGGLFRSMALTGAASGNCALYNFFLRRKLRAFNIADYVPFLGAFDLQGLTKRMKSFSKAVDTILEKIICEHEREARWKKKQQMKDFVDVLLSLMNQPMTSNEEVLYTLDRTHIKAILIDMIVASFDTSATTIEWTLSELLRHPAAMKRLQDELQTVFGLDKMVEEKDLFNLPYLDMVIKESLRLYPVGPLLLPRNCMEETIIDGYRVPKNARIIVNAWAIGRDPNAWSDNAEEFLPERFADTSIDLRGHDFQLLPFGSGRRGCPGMQLGLTITRFVLAQLVHCFNWSSQMVCCLMSWT
ncbi:hypothetical protein GH714_027277 [Hevea brasiliensis]|uniref:Cytochrome P450 n=1 Tax=Hevea brasiliensis TaxID=3981 RepID=A0A6A6LF92_HEVBR|nr:hypothetical protein GH714_027277 [Hevea brasiliensis]